MVHASLDVTSSRPMLALKQIEFNTYSVAGGAHSNNAAEMHKSVVFCAGSESLAEASTGI
jgi:hypothetical protein